jgi:hypothetical protein
MRHRRKLYRKRIVEFLNNNEGVHCAQEISRALGEVDLSSILNDLWHNGVVSREKLKTIGTEYSGPADEVYFYKLIQPSEHDHETKKFAQKEQVKTASNVGIEGFREYVSYVSWAINEYIPALEREIVELKESITEFELTSQYNDFVQLSRKAKQMHMDVGMRD